MEYGEKEKEKKERCVRLGGRKKKRKEKKNKIKLRDVKCEKREAIKEVGG